MCPGTEGLGLLCLSLGNCIAKFGENPGTSGRKVTNFKGAWEQPWSFPFVLHTSLNSSLFPLSPFPLLLPLCFLSPALSSLLPPPSRNMGCLKLAIESYTLATLTSLEVSIPGCWEEGIQLGCWLAVLKPTPYVCSKSSSNHSGTKKMTTILWIGRQFLSNRIRKAWSLMTGLAGDVGCQSILLLCGHFPQYHRKPHPEKLVIIEWGSEVVMRQKSAKLNYVFLMDHSFTNKRLRMQLNPWTLLGSSSSTAQLLRISGQEAEHERALAYEQWSHGRKSKQSLQKPQAWHPSCISTTGSC